MQNSVMLFTFLIFDREYPFWTNLVQKIKIVSLRWKLIPSLIRICRIKRCYSLFSYLTRNTLFWANLVQKIKIISLSWKLVPRLIRISWIEWWCSLFFFFWLEITFWEKFGLKRQNCQFKLKFRRYLLLQLKFRCPKGASVHPAFMGNCPTISHMF